MKWLDRLERKFGHLAIKGLVTYIVIANLIVFMLDGLLNLSIISKLVLVPSLVLKGEIWRLITYIFIPPSSSALWIIFALYFYYLVGSSLEHEWGSFRFNVYYLIGMAATTIAAFITNRGATAVYLNLSLFLAFAYLYPNFEILLFFFIPVKIKYLAWLELAFIAYTVIVGPATNRIAALASVVNFLIFFGRDFIDRLKMKRQVYRNRKRFFKEIKGGR